MRGYYRDDGLTFDVARATGTLARLLTEPRWGHVYLLHLDAAVIGYVAICFSFSLELGGNDAYVDEMFVLPQHRGHGHGMESLQQIAPLLAASGIRALHLEVDRDNTAAQQLYARVGFERRDRYFIMTRSIGT
jgi:ribosomal protein S18 acetylase RimI-like enzyme